MHDGNLHVFQDIETWSDYEDKHETLKIKYRKSKTAKKFKIKDVFKFILINEVTTVTREYKE